MQVSRAVNVAVLVAVLAIVSAPADARAQSQAGGLPVMSDRITVLETSNTDLQSALDAEIAARKAADDSLDGSIKLEAFARAVAVLDGVPAGRYFVMAKLFVENLDHDAGWTCYLLRTTETFPNTLDISGAHTNSSFPEDQSHVTLASLATLPATGSFRVQRFSIEPGSTVRWVKIIAVAVQ